MPEPKAATTWPWAFSFWIGATLELVQSLPPQRSNTQMELPSLSTSMPMVEPKGRPMEGFTQVSCALYGFGAVLDGLLPWASTEAPPKRPVMSAMENAYFI